MASRAAEVDETMAMLLKELDLVHVTDDFPQDLEAKQLDTCRSAVLDHCAAIYEYLALALKYIPRSELSNTLVSRVADSAGNTLSALVKPQPLRIAGLRIQTTREAYERALRALGNEIGQELWKKLGTVEQKVDRLPAVLQQQYQGMKFHGLI